MKSPRQRSTIALVCIFLFSLISFGVYGRIFEQFDSQSMGIIQYYVPKSFDTLFSILSLLDAQNSSLRADLVAANAMYDFFVAYMQLQRSIGKIDILMTPEARREMLDRVLQSVKGALKK